MKILSSLLISALAAIPAYATSFTFQPNPTDLNDLSHDSAYTWGISGANESTLSSQLASGYRIVSVVLTVTNIYNWDAADTDNQLFIHLLDNPLNNVTTIIDDPADNGVNQGTVSDYFSGNISSNHGIYYSGTNTYLTQYHDADGPTTKVNLTYDLTGFASTFASYIGDGHTGGSGYADFGLGFDPDCHYYNDGISLSITTSNSVPDNAVTLLLLGFGLVAMAGLHRWWPSRVLAPRVGN
jgi:hypothetical protein